MKVLFIAVFVVAVSAVTTIHGGSGKPHGSGVNTTSWINVPSQRRRTITVELKARSFAGLPFQCRARGGKQSPLSGHH
jgi:hypothetical protein